jgi:hypothetical protein
MISTEKYHDTGGKRTERSDDEPTAERPPVLISIHVDRRCPVSMPTPLDDSFADENR